MTTTLTPTNNSNTPNLSTLIETAKLNELFNIKQEENNKSFYFQHLQQQQQQQQQHLLQQQLSHHLLYKDNDLDSIQHPKIKKYLKTYHSSHKNLLLNDTTNNNNNSSSSSSSLLLNSNNNNIIKFDTHLQQQIQHQLQLQQHQRKFLEQSNFDSDDWSAPPPNSLIKGCIALASANDSDSNIVRCDTLLHGERITCFIVGGEKRLCLPQMLNYVLKDFTVQEINTVCEKLHIYCSRCTPEQLNSLKINNILPPSAPSCGLITLSDAERLCHKLLSTYISKHKKSIMLDDQENRVQLKVYHCCFGRAYGIIHPHLYNNQNAQCIECENCHLLFSPQNFVVHAHRNDESRICHWGFDSSNWRLYIKLVDSCREDSKYKQEFENFKNKFSNKRKSMNDDQIQTNGNYLFKNSNTDLHSSTSSLFKKLLKTSNELSSNNNNNNEINNNSDNHQYSSSTSSSSSSTTTNTSQNHLINNEHKLLNDLLSKPIGITSSNLLQNSAIAMYPTSISSSANSAALLNTKILSSLYSTTKNENDSNCISYRKNSKQYIDDYPLKTNDDISNTSIDILFDTLQNEIENHIKSNEIRERFANYLVRIKGAYNENLFKFVKNSLELQESKKHIELENDMLKTRIKYLELDNQSLKNQLNKSSQLLIQNTSTSSSSSSSCSSSNTSSPLSTSSLIKLQQQQQQQQQQTEKSNDNNTTTEIILNDSTNENTNVETKVENASSPQQQAAAIALISLHSPPSLSSTPKKQQSSTSSSQNKFSPNNNTKSKSSSPSQNQNTTS